MGFSGALQNLMALSSEIQAGFYQLLKCLLSQIKTVLFLYASHPPSLYLWYLLSWHCNGSADLMYDIDAKSRHGVICTVTLMDCARKAPY